MSIQYLHLHPMFCSYTTLLLLLHSILCHITLLHFIWFVFCYIPSCVILCLLHSIFCHVTFITFHFVTCYFDYIKSIVMLLLLHSCVLLLLLHSTLYHITFATLTSSCVILFPHLFLFYSLTADLVLYNALHNTSLWRCNISCFCCFFLSDTVVLKPKDDT